MIVIFFRAKGTQLDKNGEHNLLQPRKPIKRLSDAKKLENPSFIAQLRAEHGPGQYTAQNHAGRRQIIQIWRQDIE